MQISYHSALTKIQKLQNLKKKKKLFFCTGRLVRYRQVHGRYFFRYEIGGVIRSGLLAGTVYSGHTGRYGAELTPLQCIPNQNRINND